MKLTLLTIILLSINFCTAQFNNQERNYPNNNNNNSAVTIIATDNSVLSATLNGKKSTGNNISFGNIKAGTYLLTVYKLKKKNNGNNNNTAYTQVLSKYITIDKQKQYDVIVSRYNNVFFDEGRIEKEYGNNNGNNNNYYNAPATDEEFANIKKTVSQAFTDDDRLIAAKAIIKNYLLSTEQIKTLVKLCMFDDTKLALAKYSYDYCSNVSAYYQLSDAFFSNSTKTAFMQFLQDK